MPILELSSMLVSTESNWVSNDESSSLSSRQLSEYLNEEIQRIVMPTIVFIGAEMVLDFVGNLLVLYVFGFRYHVCNCKYFVLSLAVIDILTTVTTMPGEIITQIYWYVYSANVVCKVKSFCNVFTLTAEALCLLAIAIDRYRKVCRPFAWQIKTKYARIICLCIPVVALFIALPTPFLWGERSVLKTYGNYTVNVTICEKDEKFKSTNYPMIYISMVNGTICSILALMFSSYMYVFGKLVKERRRSKRNKQTCKVGVKLPVKTSPSSNSSREANRLDETSDSGVIDQGETSTTSASLKPTQILSATQKADTPMPKHLISLRKSSTRLGKDKCVRRKTLIMFIVTLAFIVTAIAYLILVSIIASENDILQKLSDASKAVYFFFLRLYFINHVINPFIYGLLDHEFKETMQMLVIRVSSRRNCCIQSRRSEN
ncbi:orexin receptor type 2-like [Mercenaria mercenaria]|uniref:orexin receptor type 2-like n=1 Tax=Mercenaria mercenaria TaxID=6596 RepID=UPI00234F8305|nr:orexin receptor type 2-like [Mercenaria mercenaria]